MSGDRELRIAEAFVSTASALAEGFDVVELLTGLTSRCAELLDIASAGLLLADSRGLLHVMAASSEATRQVELFQVQREQGPCLDSYRTGAPVLVPDLAGQEAEWPAFVEAAISAGFRSLHALPCACTARASAPWGSSTLAPAASTVAISTWPRRWPTWPA